MKKKILAVLILISQLSLVAQKKDKVLFKIDGEPTYVSEFEKLFKKEDNLTNKKNLDENLDLMVAYKLKLKQAKLEGIDTLASLQKELKTYKEDLAKPLFYDEEALDAMIKEAYDRSRYQVKASHILILTKPNDTIEAYNKIHEIKKELDNGANFEELVEKYSEDKGSKVKKGSLGYFSVFSMVYPFESAAYTTPVGEISEITKTRFGYHILKIYDKFEVDEKLRVAHLMIAGVEKDKKEKIDSIYTLLNKGEKFEDLVKKYSEDRRSSGNGGELRPFAKGTFPEPFEKAAFLLTASNIYSKPTQTAYGWHIIKYLGKDPIPKYDEVKEEIKKKVLQGDRKVKLEENSFKKVMSEFGIKINKKALAIFETDTVFSMPEETLDKALIVFKNGEIEQKDFKAYLKSKKNKKPIAFFDEFKHQKIKEYVINHIQDYNEELKEKVKTYQDGLVIFELIKRHVWDIPSQEPEKVKSFYQENIEKYKAKGNKFEDVKGYVESDYQDEVQKEWLKTLKTNSKIKFSKRQLKKLKKNYNE